MTDVTISADRFATTLEGLLKRLGSNVEHRMPAAVEKALEEGQKEWKKNARSVLSASYSRGGWGKAKANAVRYRSGKHKGQIKSGWFGRTIKTGKYANSIRHQMMSKGGQVAEGEIGSPKLPGLAHLLEKGHALVGGGSTRAFEHIAPAADKAFGDFEKFLDEAIEEAINDA